MDIEFHFFMTHLIALRAGFKPEDAFTIAYASQYTDDNKFPKRIQGGEAQYESLITQTEDITKPQEDRLGIYPVFHFCPATLSEIVKLAPKRRDGAYHGLDTLPDNRNAQKIFTAAMKTDNMYRIGIGTHMYADTFCHRDFAGWKDPFNWTRLDGIIGGIWSAVGPAIGHALAMHSPDIPPLVWEDVRLTSKYREKKNKGQILAAAGNIFDFYCKNTKPYRLETIRKKLLGDLDSAIGAEVETDSDALKDLRKANYRDLLIAECRRNGKEYKEYKETEWFDGAVDVQIDAGGMGRPERKDRYVWRGDYRLTKWYAFQQAAKAHRAVALKVFGKTFHEMEINLGNS